MTSKKTVYTEEFKIDAVRLVLEEGLSKAETSRRLGINQNLLGKWVKAFGEQREKAFPGEKGGRVRNRKNSNGCGKKTVSFEWSERS